VLYLRTVILLRLLFVILGAMLMATLRRLVGRRLHPSWTWRMEVVAIVVRWGAARAELVTSGQIRGALPGAPLPRALRTRVTVSTDTLGGIPAETTTPTGWNDGSPTVLYLHGGGYVFGSPGTHREIVARLALASGARIFSLDYRLAPEHVFPAAVDDAERAYWALLDRGVSPRQLVISGDSAGGGLCMALLARVRAGGDQGPKDLADSHGPAAKQHGSRLPAGAVLFSPWVDLSARGASIDASASHDYLTRAHIERCAAEYLGSADAREPLASPLEADFSGLPPLLVHTGGAEALLWENQELVARAERAGVKVTHWIAPGMFHAFQGFARFLPEARQSIQEAGGFVRAICSKAEIRRPQRGELSKSDTR